MPISSAQKEQLTLIFDYFPGLSNPQRQKFEQLGALYTDWNKKINVISRKDIENLYLHHILHSLAIARVISFKKETKILDIGTGGGLPGIPLAIMFPDSQFHLVDSVGKKIKVCQEISMALNLKNVSAEQTRIEQTKNQYDFVTGRAVTNLPEFYNQAKKNVRPHSFNALFNGILYLKGGEIEKEITRTGFNYALYPIEEYFQEPYFKEKFVVYIPVD